MADINDFLDALKSQLTDIAKEVGGDIKDELIRDGTGFFEKSKDDLQRWMSLLEEGKLTRDEFEYLLEAKKDLAEMEALKQKGLAKARIDKLKGALFNAILGSALRTFQ